MSISEFQSKDDLVQSIAASCHIPAYNDGQVTLLLSDLHSCEGIQCVTSDESLVTH